MIELHIIPFREFAEGMSEHWTGDPCLTPVFNNPFGIIQYPNRSLWQREIILFPVKLTVDGKDAAFSCIYNISDRIIRTRGIYVKPEFRGHGLGFEIVKRSRELFPLSFNIWLEFFSLDYAKKFKKYGAKQVPETSYFWSTYSDRHLVLLYERLSRPNCPWVIPFESLEFIDKHRESFSLGGTNNMNVDWNDEAWRKYFEQHAGNYPIKVNQQILTDLVNNEELTP